MPQIDNRAETFYRRSHTRNRSRERSFNEFFFVVAAVIVIHCSANILLSFDSISISLAMFDEMQKKQHSIEL